MVDIGCGTNLFAIRMFSIEICRNKSSLTPALCKPILSFPDLWYNFVLYSCDCHRQTNSRCKVLKFSELLLNSLSFILHLQNIKTWNIYLLQPETSILVSASTLVKKGYKTQIITQNSNFHTPLAVLDFSKKSLHAHNLGYMHMEYSTKCRPVLRMHGAHDGTTYIVMPKWYR